MCGAACERSEGDSESGIPAAGERSTAAAAPTVLITGSNRGIGLEFAKQYAERGWKVIATARNPDAAEDLHALAAIHPGVVIEYLDVTDHAGIDSLAERYRGQPIDVLINNAGVLGDPDRQRLNVLDFEIFQEVMAVNTFGPLRVSQAFLEHVAASDQRKIIVITSISGSVEVAGNGGGFYFYKISKAGANMAMRTLNSESRNRGLNVRVGLIHPGTVNTRMLGDARDRPGTMDPEESVAAMIRVIEDLTDENAGTFLRYDGRTLPW
jgi:NAD(P)-dependent dehydrogenase (short-subunit alcohol dehydrogenase family)